MPDTMVHWAKHAPMMSYHPLAKKSTKKKRKNDHQKISCSMQHHGRCQTRAYSLQPSMISVY